MASLLAFVKKRSKPVLRALEHLDRKRIPVKLEIEHTDYRYTTTLAVRRNLLVFAKPIGLGKAIRKGVFVRFRVPDAAQAEVRAQVVTPDFSLANGATVFLCNIPDDYVAGARREAERYNTARYNNLLLATWGLNDTANEPDRHRIVDLSNSGCKIYCTGSEAKILFSVGEAIQPAELLLGNRLKVQLETVWPRVHYASAVGCEFKVSPEGLNLKYFAHLILSLERGEARRLKAVTL